MTPTVREVMSPPPPCVGRADTVVMVARKMRALGVSSVAVADDLGTFVGMASEPDIIERCVADGRDPRRMDAGALLRDGQEWVDPDRRADSDLLAMILRHVLSDLPVVQDGRLVGMIGAADLAAPLVDDDLPDAVADHWLSELRPHPDR